MSSRVPPAAPTSPPADPGSRVASGTAPPGLEPTSCSYVMGEDGLARWSDVHAEAWIGFLETQKRLSRALDAELEAEHGLSLSALEVLGRLGAADDHNLRLSALADACGLSLSRVSRIIDALEARELVERQAVRSDGRAVHAHLTDAGLQLVRAARCSHFAAVQRAFFDQLSEDEIRTLAEIFGRLAPRAVEACSSSD